MRAVLLLVCGLAACQVAPTSELQSRPVSHRDGDARVDGWLSFDPRSAGPRPAVLVVPGSKAEARARAEQFARLGYVTLAANVSGEQIAAAVALLTAQPQSAPHAMAGVGYGTGGSALLEFARSSPDLTGVAILHADPNELKADASRLTARVLMLHGSDDSRWTPAAQGRFEAQLRSGNVDWDIIRYGAVGAAFTDRSSKEFDTDADARAHAAVRQFLAELFPTKSNLAKPVASAKPTAARGIPERAFRVLQHVDELDRAPDGYEGGRTFGNYERRLPAADARGRRMRYREWDVHPLRPGVNRGPERLVTGADGSAYFTDDHYSTFKKIR